MHEILSSLPVDAWVLDLGCDQGSFPLSSTAAHVLRLDQQFAGVAGVRADASQLPLRNASVRAVIANHSLEHSDDLDACLREIGRVIEPGGALFVSVPDASTYYG